jgi:hypothetical protein
MSKTYVIAGNNQQFTDFVKRKLMEEFDHSIANDIPFNGSMSDYVYIREPRRLVGVNNPKGYLVGTWRELPEIRSILINLQIATKGRAPIIRELYDSLCG